VFGLGIATKIYIALDAVDMRKGFEGLHGLVRDQLGQDPLSGHLFLFTNRTRTRLKALVWDSCEVPRYVELTLARASLSSFLSSSHST
jgi:transposase